MLTLYTKPEDITKASINSCADINDDNFTKYKNEISKIFKQIKTNNEKRVEKELIEQTININKVNDYAEKNFIGYGKNALLRNISVLNKISTGSARGYNRLFFKERFVDKANLHIADDDTFGEGLARSEDNYLLNCIISKQKLKLKEVEISNLGKLIKKKSSSFKYALIWSKSHIFLEEITQDVGFIPRWQTDKKDLKQKGFQGEINNLEIYNIYPFNDDENQIDTVIFLNKGDIVLDEFQPEKDSGTGVYSVTSDDYSMELSIKNLSELTEEELAEVKIDPEPPKDLKSKVILKLYRGSELSGESNFNSIEIYKIK